LEFALGHQDGVRFGYECADENQNDHRAVVQFSIDALLFDWLFNARTGYRAHFFAHYKRGLRFNNRIVAALLAVLEARLPEGINARRIGPGFTDRGPVQVPKDFLQRSLIRYLSKVWMCTKRIGSDGVIEALPTGVVGEPNLLLPGKQWTAYYRTPETAWLDIKGGFVDQGRHVYQPKGPIGRAKKLQQTGNA
jgi:hypothetical protein